MGLTLFNQEAAGAGGQPPASAFSLWHTCQQQVQLFLFIMLAGEICWPAGKILPI